LEKKEKRNEKKKKKGESWKKNEKVQKKRKSEKKENKKTIWKNTVAIYSILKEKNYKAKFLTSSIFKK
jgi:hypothetical protein